MNLIDRSKWTQLFDNIEKTLTDVSTLPPGPVTAASLAARDANRVLYAALVAKMRTPQLDRAMSNEEFWGKVVALPLWTARGASFGEMIKATVKHMTFSGEWIEDGPERSAMLRDRKYLNRGPRQVVLEEAVRFHRKYLRDNPGRTLVDLYVEETQTDEASLCAIFDRLWNIMDAGPVTTFHMMMDLGLPVLKPDRVVTLVAVRLGLVRRYEGRSEVRGNKTTTTTDLPSNLPQGKMTVAKVSNDLDFGWALQRVIREISAETGRSVREIDRLLVKLGAQAKPADGLVQAVCAKEQPQCHVCLANSICAFGKFNRKEAKRQALALAA